METTSEFDMNEIYRGYFKTALYLALPIMGDYDKAEEVVQKSMIKIWEKQHTFDKDKANFYAWFKRIVINTAYDEVRAEITRRYDPMEVIDYDTQNIHTINTDTIDFDTHFNKLKLKYRLVMHLHHIEGYTHEGIAERLDIPLGTVKSRLKIGKRDLIKIYTE